jgi:gas vesicle protein
MTRGSTILLAALGGAVVAALVAQYLSTEQGKQLLSSATDTLKDVSNQAKEIARNNLAEVLDETKSTVGKVVKDKLAQQLQRQTP